MCYLQILTHPTGVPYVECGVLESECLIAEFVAIYTYIPPAVNIQDTKELWEGETRKLRQRG